MTAVTLEVADGVATVTLNTPENRNSLSVRLRTALDGALREATETAKVIVLTGAGPVFCAGADLKEGNLDEGPPLTGILTRLMDSPVPTVAVLNGPARAGGIGLVAACDIALAPETATFAFSEVRIGVIPAIISVPVLRVMTPRAAARYFLTGEVFDARAALESGLLTAVGEHPAPIVAALLEGAPRAMAGAKRLLREMPTLPRETALSYAERVSALFFAGADAEEGRAAFAEKRPPAWSPRTS